MVIDLFLYLLLIQSCHYTRSLPGIVETIAGGGSSHKGKDSDCNDFERSKDGVRFDARFNYPWGIAYDYNNNAVYVGDCGCFESEHRTDLIRKIDLRTSLVTTIAGSTQGYKDGFGTDTHFQHIAGITLDPEMDMLYIADSGNNRIRVLYLSNYKVDTVAGLSSKGLVDQSTLSSHFNNPQSIAIHRNDRSERLLYIADTDNHAIRVIHLNSDHTGDVKTIAGGTKGFKDGIRLKARFFYPTQIDIDGLGEYLYISDHYNHAIRRLEITTGKVTTLTSQGFQTHLDEKSPHIPITIHYPEGIAYDPDYKLLYVCEFQTHVVQVLSLEGLVKPLAGSGFKGKKDGFGQNAKFYHPSGLTYDRRKKMLYVGDQYNHIIRSVSGVGSKKKHLKIPKKSNNKRQVSNQTQNSSISSSQSLLIAGGFFLVMFGAIFVRPLFRLIFKFSNNEQQSVFSW